MAHRPWTAATARFERPAAPERKGFAALPAPRHGESAGRAQPAPHTRAERVAAHDRWNYTARGETPTQRLDRNYGEILQEVRVAQTGVQLLLAFLLTLAFTPRFSALTPFQLNVYVASLILGAAATALLIAPAPFHRLVFQRRLKRRLVKACGLFVLAGLTLLMLSLSSAMLLILDIVLGSHLAAWITGATLGWFGLWWYAVPLWNRARHGYDGRDQPEAP